MAIEGDSTHKTAEAALAAARQGANDSEHHCRCGGSGGNGVVYVSDGQGGAMRFEKGPDGQTVGERRIPPR